MGAWRRVPLEIEVLGHVSAGSGGAMRRKVPGVDECCAECNVVVRFDSVSLGSFRRCSLAGEFARQKPHVYATAHMRASASARARERCIVCVVRVCECLAHLHVRLVACPRVLSLSLGTSRERAAHGLLWFNVTLPLSVLRSRSACDSLI